MKKNLRAWFDAGVTCVGIGSQLISKEILQQGDYQLLENKTRAALAIIQSLKP